MEDILEELVGDIMDEDDPVEEPLSPLPERADDAEKRAAV